MIICGIMRLISLNLSLKLSYIYIVLFIPFPIVCGTPHNSSQLESYGHEKLENPGFDNGPKFV
jgi:hypothetical protein